MANQDAVDEQEQRVVRLRPKDGASGDVSGLSDDLRLVIDRVLEAKRYLAQFLDASGDLSEQQEHAFINALNAASLTIDAVTTTTGAECQGAELPMPEPSGVDREGARSQICNSLKALQSRVQWISGLAAADDLKVTGVRAARMTLNTRRRRSSVLMSRQWSVAAAEQPSGSATCNPLTGIDQPLLHALTTALGNVKSLIDIAIEEIIEPETGYEELPAVVEVAEKIPPPQGYAR